MRKIKNKSEIVLGKKSNFLKTKTVFLVGVGGTGSTVATLLSRQGVKLILIDRDIIEESNLER